MTNILVFRTTNYHRENCFLGPVGHLSRQEGTLMESVIEHVGQVGPAKPHGRPRRAAKRRRQPRYSVILWDDDDHTYQYVIAMMRQLFRMATESAFQVAREVDTSGRAVCLTGTREYAEFKRDQIHAFGRDHQIARSCGSMKATIEPVPGDEA